MLTETIFDLEDNISALVIAIFREDVYTVEDAFDALDGIKRRTRPDIDTKELIGLKKEGLTYRGIANIFGITEAAVFRRINKKQG